MNALLALLLLAAPIENPGGQAFQLGPGEYRWVPFSVNQAPSEVEVRFEVLKGGPTVHAELLAMDEFRQFNRGKTHSVLASTESSKAASFQKLILVRGRYAAVIANSTTGALATVSLGLRVDANPRGAVATELTQERRLIIILISFLFFVITAGWSARKLLRAMQRV